jgi:HlyD family secretion protein
MMKLAALTIGVTGLVFLAPEAADWSLGNLLTPPRSEAKQTDLSKYRVAQVEQLQITKLVKATGSLKPLVTAEVGSQLSGQVAFLRADFNDVVKKGQVLAQLDQRTFRAALDAAKAALESARSDERTASARLVRATIDVRQAEAQQMVLKARIEKTKVLLDLATREAERKSILAERGAAASTDALDSRSRRDAATADLHEAKALLAANGVAIEAARADFDRLTQEAATTHAAVEKADAQVNTAAIDLARTNITSPIDGVVVGRNVTEGQTVASSLEARTLFLIAQDLRRMEIHALVDETDIAKIAVGQKATFTVDAFPDRQFKATVTSVRKAAQVVQNVVTYTVVLEASNGEYALLPGMTALVSITVEHTTVPMSVPSAALHVMPDPASAPAARAAGTQSVWILASGNMPTRVPVRVGRDQDDRVEVSSDAIKPGDRVLIGDEGLDHAHQPVRGAR